MSLSYAELLSAQSIALENIGHLRRISVSEAQNAFKIYNSHVSICTSNVEEYYEQNNRLDEYDAMTLEEKSQINVFDLLTGSPDSLLLFQYALNFFFEETVTWNADLGMFVLTDADGKDCGIIFRDVWNELRSLIAATNYITLTESAADLSAIKNKKARKIAEKLQKGRKKMATEKSKAQNSLSEFGNIVSIIASYMPGYTHFNIGDLTIYQLYDLYHRFQINETYSIVRTSVAVWGDEKKQFDVTERQQNLHARQNKDSE